MITRVSLVLLSWLLTWSRAQLLDSNSWMSNGLCRYGNSVDCCWGWTQTDGGRCQPHCQQGCKHGECVGPDRCKCHAGYSGKACNQDLNECGLKPRPCKHRCMNTPGSYKCYCLDGYTLQPDGSCKNTLTCYYANCQYGCAVSKGRVLCTCPSPGLRLGPDRRTCIDIDECVSGGGVCPRRRKCVNTFGSFLCKCHLGFKLTYMNGRYVCIDKDTRPFCSLNPSSPKCRCKDGGCEVLPRVTLEPPRPRTTIPIIPLSTAAPPITTTAQPVTTTTTTSAATNLRATINKDVTLKQRGDVHIPRHPDLNQLWEFDIELGNISDDAKDDPDAGVVHCTFNHGLCDWLSDREGDLHWEISHNPAGGQYLSVPELKAGQRSIRGARLAVQILPSWSHGDLCFSFSHWLTGHHVGVLQLFTRKRGRGQRYSPALWSRTGGHGWRHTQVTLTTHHLDRVLLKAERRVGRRGQIAVDDVTLRQGACR
ncbi:unnamed protein product [Pleuronectes platessa]|uniref:Nephronectin n=1 Tax=Pleuronectes platessa TaxID=8262 RepID=A0A9N7U304_PLEPL|nr:unnamed protein product [Pleuronectes platessa]